MVARAKQRSVDTVTEYVNTEVNTIATGHEKGLIDGHGADEKGACCVVCSFDKLSGEACLKTEGSGCSK